MGKNKKSGGLIEDRVIRNPMDQMRRKLKFKEKEKRKEVRQITRELREEFGMPTKGQKHGCDPMLGHDPSFINQLKQGGGGCKEENEGEEPSGPTQQELATQMWDHMEQNYNKMSHGQQVDFNQDPFKAKDFDPLNQQMRGTGPSKQPYQKKNEQNSGQSVFSSKPFLYNGQEASEEQQKQQTEQGSQAKSNANQQKSKHPKRNEQDLSDPFDPSNGQKNFGKKADKDPLSIVSDQFEKLRKQPGAIIGAAPSTMPSVEQYEAEQATQRARLIPAALRRRAQLAMSRAPSLAVFPEVPDRAQPEEEKKEESDQLSVPMPSNAFRILLDDHSSDEELPANIDQTPKFGDKQPTSVLAALNAYQTSDSEDSEQSEEVVVQPKLPVSHLNFNRTKVWGKK